MNRAFHVSFHVGLASIQVGRSPAPRVRYEARGDALRGRRKNKCLREKTRNVQRPLERRAHGKAERFERFLQHIVRSVDGVHLVPREISGGARGEQ